MDEVQHDSESKKFFIKNKGQEAHMTYHYQDNETLVYAHTFVPPELRGSGLAGKVVRTALEWARSQGLKVVPTCSYVQKFVRRHPEFQDVANIE